LEARLSIMKVYSRGCEKLFPGSFQFATDDEFNYFLSHQLNSRLATKLNDRMEKLKNQDSRNGRVTSKWSSDEIVRMCREIDDKETRNKQLINEQNREAGLISEDVLTTSSYHLASLPRALQVVMGTLNNATHMIDQERQLNNALTNVVGDANEFENEKKRTEPTTAQKLTTDNSTIVEEVMKEMSKKTECFQKLIDEQTAKIKAIEVERAKKNSEKRNENREREARPNGSRFGYRGRNQASYHSYHQQAPQPYQPYQVTQQVPNVQALPMPPAMNTPAAMVQQPMINYAQQVAIPNSIQANAANAMNDAFNLLNRTPTSSMNFMTNPQGQSDGACFNCGKSGHKARDCRENVKCVNCNETGHVVYRCPSPPKRPCRHCGKGDHFDFQCPWRNDARNTITSIPISTTQKRVNFLQPGAQQK